MDSKEIVWRLEPIYEGIDFIGEIVMSVSAGRGVEQKTGDFSSREGAESDEARQDIAEGHSYVQQAAFVLYV